MHTHRGAGVAPSVEGSKIDLDRCSVTDEDVARMAVAVSTALASGGGAPTILTLQGNALTDDAVPGLCAILELGVLRELILGYNNFTEVGVSRLAESLPGRTEGGSVEADSPTPTTLETLDLTFNDIGDG